MRQFDKIQSVSNRIFVADGTVTKIGTTERLSISPFRQDEFNRAQDAKRMVRLDTVDAPTHRFAILLDRLIKSQGV